MSPETPLSESEDVQAVQDDRPVYFRSIEVENVLCFKSRQTLDLTDTNGCPAKWTVILGDNGVGKTTLLRCLAGMESRPAYVIGPKEHHIPRLWGIDSAGGLISQWPNYSALIKSKAKVLATFHLGHTLTEWESISFKEKLDPDLIGVQEVRVGGHILGKGMRKGALSQKFRGLKCYGYGASRRMGETSLKESLESDSTASLFSDNATLLNAEEWLLQTDYSIVFSARTGTVNPKLQRRYDLIKDILKELLPDVEDIRIVMADENRSGAIAEFLTPYGWVPLSSLGLGYRTVIAWTVDLAARMLDRYPDSDDPLSEPAVVLVDEIDLHLHPKWQRTIMTFLGDRFKKTQFIVTAHSPLVVQAAQNANLVILRREGDEVIIDNNPEIIKNWRVDQVLTSVFELPTSLPANIEPLMERRAKLLSKSKLTAKDERELKKLEDQIGTIPTAESREDIRAMDIIRQAAKLLENR
jgi:energy-coupling factor transporter ATP-binding protein EcfA2